jgi:DMSO/TMAO reductase YedYZ molybdopterin-dependent catalytic subunit
VTEGVSKPDLPDSLDPFRLTRRSFLQAALLVPTALRQSGAKLLGTVPLGDPGGASPPPFGRLLGDGLDARLFTDLSQIAEPSDLRTATDRFFVRTAAPPSLPSGDAWTIQVGGLGQAPAAVRLRDLDTLVTPSRRILLECSGNADQTNYGLLSAADWEGIPVAALLDRVRTHGADRVLISGIDDDRRAWRTSIAGASWIFTRDELQQAVLAIRMNGEALPLHHGAPVRLLVPGWYGCACVKWVDRIELVADDAAATSQMREFAARTHQDPRAALARDFVPAVIDTAAMPIRVEKWSADGSIFYRIIGLVWGGTKPTDALSIRFKSGGPWEKVADCPLPESPLTWSLWSHTWRPREPGRYQIVLRVDDASIRTRRLDVFFYVREIDIDEI